MHKTAAQDGDLTTTGQQVRDLQDSVERLEGRDAEAAKAAEVLKARVTLLEGSVRLLQSTSTRMRMTHCLQATCKCIVWLLNVSSRTQCVP